LRRTLDAATIEDPQASMFDPDLALVALLLFIVLAALLFPGGPGTPRRVRVQL